MNTVEIGATDQFFHAAYNEFGSIGGSMGPLMPSIAYHAFMSNGFVLELGTFTGEGSTRAIQFGLNYHPNPFHISVDWEDNIRPEWRPQSPRWTMVVGDTRKVETLTEARMKAEYLGACFSPGLIFIDTLHDYDQMRVELELWSVWAGENTVWLMHDIFMYGPRNEGMVWAIEEFADKNGWVYEDYRQDSHGLGRMFKR